MKFIHAADIHLDSPLHGLSAYTDAPATRLRNASREAFTKLVDHAVDEAVDFVIIAGDLYDGDWRDYNTGIFFIKEMGRLKRAGIRVFVLFGNHDAESEMTRRLELPDNVITFSHKKPEIHKLDDLKVALHGQSFKEKATTANLAETYHPPVPGYFNIGVLHTALQGYTAHAPYAPCSLDELHAKGYDYWALGHIHEFEQWTGKSNIVFPGNLQGRHIRETGRRGAVLVSVDDGQVTIERLFIDVLRWESLEVDVSNCMSMGEVVRQVGLKLEDLLVVDGHVPRAVRVTVRGRSHAHGALFGRNDELRADVIGQIAAIGNDYLWLEKVKVETEPVESASSISDRMDAIADLQEFLRDAEMDDEFLQQLQNELRPFYSKVPLDITTDAPLLKFVREGQFSELVKYLSPALLANLASGE